MNNNSKENQNRQGVVPNIFNLYGRTNLSAAEIFQQRQEKRVNIGQDAKK